jgi:uncharacterized membrane protein
LNNPEAQARWAVHYLLLGGVALSALLMGAGLLGSALGSPSGVEWIRGGILVLTLTPVARVALLAASYALRRDWFFFPISCGVLLLLAVGIILGLKN